MKTKKEVPLAQDVLFDVYWVVQLVARSKALKKVLG